MTISSVAATLEASVDGQVGAALAAFTLLIHAAPCENRSVRYQLMIKWFLGGHLPSIVITS